MATVVYLMCLAASAACAWLLVRSYLRNRSALLLWTAIAFVFLALNNFMVVIDLVLTPSEVDLRALRHASSLVAVGTLIYGFIWELD